MIQMAAQMRFMKDCSWLKVVESQLGIVLLEVKVFVCFIIGMFSMKKNFVELHKERIKIGSDVQVSDFSLG